jgi:hypothetical protein
MSFEERYEGFCVDLVMINTIYLSLDNQSMSFEKRYEAFCVDLIKVNIIYLSHDIQKLCLLGRDTRDSAWTSSR